MSQQTFAAIQETDFYRFFNCNEKSSKEKKELVEKHIKTGGFQEHIDIFFLLNEKGEIVEARLLLDRSWIGNRENVNPFAKDIAKSFVEVMTPTTEAKETAPLVNCLFALQGLKDKVIRIKDQNSSSEKPTTEILKILEVFVGVQPEMSYLLLSSMFHFRNFEENDKKKLEVSWKVI